MPAEQTWTWKIEQSDALGNTYARNIQAAYYKIDPNDWSVQFKDRDDKILLAIPKDLVQAIERGELVPDVDGAVVSGNVQGDSLVDVAAVMREFERRQTLQLRTT